MPRNRREGGIAYVQFTGEIQTVHRHPKKADLLAINCMSQRFLEDGTVRSELWLRVNVYGEPKPSIEAAKAGDRIAFSGVLDRMWTFTKGDGQIGVGGDVLASQEAIVVEPWQ